MVKGGRETIYKKQIEASIESSGAVYPPYSTSPAILPHREHLTEYQGVHTPPLPLPELHISRSRSAYTHPTKTDHPFSFPIPIPIPKPSTPPPHSENRIHKITPSRSPRSKNSRIPKLTAQLLRPLSMVLMLGMRRVGRVLGRLGDGGRVDVVVALGVAGVDVGGGDTALLL